MSKILLVVDGKEQTYIAIRHLMDLATKSQNDSVVILNVQPAGLPRHHAPRFHASLKGEAAGHARMLVSATGPWLNGAGISYETRSCTGNVAAAAAHLAEIESCDQIVIAERPAGRIARILRRLTGLRSTSLLDDLLPFSRVPVTVVTQRAVDRQKRHHTVGGQTAQRI